MALDNSALLTRLASNPTTITVTLTRPNDTTAYVAGDAIANATSSAAMLTFANVARKPGGSFLLNRLSWHMSGNPTNKLDAFLQLLDTTMATPPNDNAALVMTNGENLTLVAGVFLPGQTTNINVSVGNTGISGEQVMYADNLNLLLTCAAGSTSLYGLFTVANGSGYTPIAVETFTFKLYGEQL